MHKIKRNLLQFAQFWLKTLNLSRNRRQTQVTESVSTTTSDTTTMGEVKTYYYYGYKVLGLDDFKSVPPSGGG